VGESQFEAINTSSSPRRQALRTLSAIACGALAVALAGCGQGSVEGLEKPDWMRSKRGSTGNGAGRR